eukprot:scaffold20533_cov137-Skeletonema_menzelii.AAC.1
MIAHYLGIENSYVVIGGPSSYAIPNISFEVRQTKSGMLMKEIVEHIGKRLHPRHVRTSTAIHVITVSREDAKRLSGMINDTGTKAEWLTSDCSAKERQLKVQSWDNGQLQVLVSTYCLGLDSAKVREVIVVGGCSSVCNAIQCAGRIRPKQQKGEETKVYFWLDDRNWLQNNDQMQQRMNYLAAAGYFDCYETQEQLTKAKMDIAGLYDHTGLEGVLYNRNQCIMIGLHKHLGVVTSECGKCQYCRNDKVFFRQHQKAKEAEQRHKDDKDFVLQYFQTIAQRCIICNNSQCNGFNCIATSATLQYWCFRCFGYTGPGSNNYHKHSECACRVEQMNTRGKCCPNCYLAIGGDMPNCGSIQQHRTRNCIHKERIKRILLFDLVAAKDCGVSAFNRLDPLLTNHRYAKLHQSQQQQQCWGTLPTEHNVYLQYGYFAGSAIM